MSAYVVECRGSSGCTRSRSKDVIFLAPTITMRTHSLIQTPLNLSTTVVNSQVIVFIY